MNQDQKDIKQALEKILDTCKDGIKGYEKAAQEIEDTNLRAIFLKFAQQRKNFIEELKYDARDLGINPEASGTFKGYFHRLWIDMRTTFSKTEIATVLQESIRGETTAIDLYNEVLNQRELPTYLQTKLIKQRQEIHEALVDLEMFDVALKVEE